MARSLKGRSFLKLLDFSPAEIRDLLALAATLKRQKRAGIRGRSLAGKSIALVFEKPSTRTRCAFTVACVDERAHPEYLGKGDIQLGKKESVADTARVLGRMFDGIEFRGFAHATVEGLAEHAGVPVWNGLTDAWHPTQILADLLTIEEEFDRLEGLAVAYVGDGRNNVASSLMVGCAKLGVDVRVAAPEALQPAPAVLAEVERLAAASGSEVVITADPERGVEGAHAVYTDVWVSMGEEGKLGERIELLRPYRITRELMEATGRREAVFLHCLPCFHNTDTEVSAANPEICEATDEVFEGRWSRVFDEAENRLHTIKAVMVATLAG